MSITIAIFALLLLITTSYRALRASQFSGWLAGSVSALAAGQAGMATGGMALWLALAACAIAVAAVRFATSKSLRALVSLGGALSFIQLVDPIGGIVAAVMLPIAVGERNTPRGDIPGLLVLLLFMPVFTAIVLTVLFWRLHFNFAADVLGEVSPAILLARPEGFDLLPRSLESVAGLLCALPAFAPLFFRATRTLALQVVGAVLLALLLAQLAVAANVWRSPSVGLAIAAPLTAIAIAAWPPAWRTPVRVLSASAMALVISWMVLLLA